MKRLSFLICLIALFALPTLAQQDAEIAIQLDSQTINEGDEIIANIMVLNSTDIAGADIAISVDGECLQVQNMVPGDYLPSSAENGGFSPRNTFDTTTARLAANVTSRQHIANGDGTFMSVQMNAGCTGESVIEITRAELVTGQGEQFTATFAPISLDIGGSQDVVSRGAEVINTALAVDNNDNSLFFVALGLMLFGLLGFFALLGWRFTRGTVSVSG